MPPQPQEVNVSSVLPQRHFLFRVTATSKVLAAILFILLPFAGFYFGIQYAGYEKEVYEIEQSEIVTETNEVQEKEERDSSAVIQNSDSEYYVSERLGIKFKNSPAYHFHEDDFNDMLVSYSLNSDGSIFHSHTNYMQMFEKDPNDSFEDAVYRMLNLKSVDGLSVKCKLNIGRNGLRDDSRDDEKYLVANLVYEPGSDDDQDPEFLFFAAAELCNAEYGTVNAVRFFLYDQVHPDRYYFFSLGQDPHLWYKNLEFIDIQD